MAKISTLDRRSYAKLSFEAEMPNLLAIQLESFEEFLQADIPSEKRKHIGLQRVFTEIFPVSDIRENYLVEFVRYSIGKPRYSIHECQDRKRTYAVQLKATRRLISYRQNEDEEGGKDL